MGNFGGFAVGVFNPIGPAALVGPVTDGDYALGYGRGEVSAIRSRLQTLAASGGDRELATEWFVELNARFSVAVVGTNYYSIDAGLAAMAAADLYVLDPEDPSWAAAGMSFVSLSAINTKQKCWTLADNLIRKSTYHQGEDDGPGNTCLAYLTAAASDPDASDGSGGEGVHIWANTPVMTSTPVWYVWERIRGELDATAQAAFTAAMLLWVAGSLPALTLHGYPDFTSSEVQFTNHALAVVRGLSPAGARVLLGTGVATVPQETVIRTAFTNAYLNRVALEYSALAVVDGQASPAFNEASTAGSGYARDNASGAARLALYLAADTTWRAAHVQDTWFNTLPQAVLKGVFPGTNLTNPNMGYVMMLGELEMFERLPDSGEWLWICAAAMSRYGLTTAARRMRWLLDTYLPKTTVGGIAIPSEGNSPAFRSAWSWHLVMGGTVYGLTPLPMTGFDTRRGPLGSLIDSELFSNPTRGSWVAWFPIEEKYTSRPSDDTHIGRLQIYTRGSWVQLRYVGNGKGPFASDVGGGRYYATISHPGIRRLAGPSAWTASALGFQEGFPPSYPADTSMAAASNANIFDLMGARYASDPDHASGFYGGFEQFRTAATVSRMQSMVFTHLTKDLVVEFVRTTPSAGYAATYAWTSPVHLTFHDGTTVVPTHWLAGAHASIPPGTAAKGAWISADATTFAGENSHAAFTATHNNASVLWPAADAKWFVTVLTAAVTKDFRLEYRGYDATYVAGAHRENMEIQPGTSDYGRNGKTAWVGLNAAHTGGIASTTITLTDAPPALSNIGAIALATPGGGAPTRRTGTYNAGAGTFVVAGAAFTISAGSPFHYNLLDAGSDTVEYYSNLDGDTDQVRIVAGDGSARVLTDSAAKVEWAIVRKMGAASDGAFTAPPTYTRMLESDVWGVHVATDNVAFVVARAHMSRTDPAAWLNGYDVLVPTLTTTQCHFADLRPGTYTVTGAVEGGTNMRITATPSGGGTFLAGPGGRIVATATHSAGLVVVS